MIDGILAWLSGINLAAFVLMGADKRRAQRGAWRIPERTLLAAALLGGTAGAMLGMKTFHHKTRHWQFRYGLPVLLLIQLAAAAWLVQSGTV